MSVIFNLSKIFESLIRSRLNYFFKSQNLLQNNQFGFRSGRSTEHAALNLIDRVSPALSQNAYGICVLLDFSSCFDTVSHNLLFNKLQRYGVRGEPLNFIKSYFSERMQYVAYGGEESEMTELKMGVVQGSKGGPLYFDIYSGDLDNLCDDKEAIMFADDTCSVYVQCTS